MTSVVRDDIDPRLRDSTTPYDQHSRPAQSPHSARHSPDNSADAPDGGEGANDPKKPRACEACRGLKVRCEPGPDTEGPCKRCAKANRQCIVTVPSRKRQKKTDSRVAELEKKIDALTASLHAQKSEPPSSHTIRPEQSTSSRVNSYEQVTNGGFGAGFGVRQDIRKGPNDWATPDRYPKVPELDTVKASAPPMVMAGQKRKLAETRDSYTRPGSISLESRRSVDTGPRKQFIQSENGGQAKTPKSNQTHEYADVIDRGIITAETATDMFRCYVEQMAPHMPVVVFPAGTTASDVRKSKPTLFLAILSASSGTRYPEVQRMLTKEVMSIYADRIICNGEKTLELVQALHISTLWYWPPEHYEELKFYQLIHIAAVMAIDIGMGKRTKPQKSVNAGLWRDHPWRRTPYPDPELIETRRAWLGCYFLCCNASMGLRRPNLIRWNSYMNECVEVLETSPDALDSDKFLTQWVRSQRIAEEVGTQFSMDDPSANISITDLKVQYALRGFERDLERWSSQVPPNVRTPTLIMTENVINLYMHEVAMHVDHNVDEFKPPFTENSLRGIATEEPDSLTSAHISALSVCLTSIDGIFDTFLQLDIEVIRCLPIAHFVRVAYAVVILIKMYFAAATPNSELGKVINKDNMKVERYLDGLVETFRAAASNERSRPAAKFLMVLLMLKTWFHRQRAGKEPPASGDQILSLATARLEGESAPKDPVHGSSGETHQPSSYDQHTQPASSSGYGQPNNSLQLLSEVATGNPRAQPHGDANGIDAQTQNGWNQQGYGNYDQSVGQMPGSVPQAYAPGMNMNIDPALNMDLEYSLGDGFEQAMGMTLGNDFDKYFSGDAFFGGIMDTVGGSGSVFDGFGH
ncbi:hypothetical protein BP5796_07427 [Coleophoma crateriformis]|uniref:Zn(2)-C6 fungal-type domain-containing protein n=1 Tax=Coleophoma crateriformis TaxID=565419 RepID=A0A3D8RIW3_9HELO|nr:hypothetical protein BP5796_07427 [Coleophoma crateriformis]